MANNNRPLIDKQTWQPAESMPVVSSALSALTTSEDGLDRFMYFLAGANFYRYDGYGNAPQKLASPLLIPTVFTSLRYSKFGGTRGPVISSTSNSLRIAPINAPLLVGKTLKIISGTGAGQVRTILTSPEATVYEQGLATTASATQLGDSTKKWKINQWKGYQVNITYGTGATQIRRILYNNETTITVSDTNHQSQDNYNNEGFAVVPVVTTGLQAHFTIEANDITVDNWVTQPDYSSRFMIETGNIWLLTSRTAAPFYSIQCYDVLGDYWINKTATSGLYTAVFGTDGTIERTGEIGGIYKSGTATGGTTFTLSDSTMTGVRINQYKNYRIRITGGTGIGQNRRIIANGLTSCEVGRTWSTIPDITSTYEIIADKDKIYIAGNGQSRMLQYDIDSDLILLGSKYDNGIANILGVQYDGVEQNTIAITSGARGANGITVLNPTPTAGGTLYTVGDVLTITTGGTNGKAIVETISTGGVVTSVSLIRSGANYTTGAGKVTSGGTGTGCTLNITTVGTVCLVTTPINHNFQTGQQVVISGDSLYAGTVTITGVDGLTTFTFSTSAAASMVAPVALSATVIVDSSKSRIIDEHKGKIIQTNLVGLTGVVQPRVILSNTATSIIVDTITTALVNGTGRYTIVSPSAFGRDEQQKVLDKFACGMATGGSITTLVDTTKNWKVDSLINSKMRISSGTGRDSVIIITGNTSNTLTYTTQTFTPDTTTEYCIYDTYGTCTGAGSTTTLVDTTKNWGVNQWAGKKVCITGGAGFGLTAGLNEILIVSNTATVLTFAAITGFAPDATTTYTILGIPARGAGIQLVWLFGGASAGRFMFLPRGSASNTADRYDITTEKWEYGFLFSPQTDTLTTGSYYAYDGVDRVYFSPGVATGIVQYVYYFDLLTNRAYAFGSVPNTQLAPVLGNRMEILTSSTGESYLYHMRNTGAEIYRASIFF